MTRAQEILERVAVTLEDPEFVRWPKAELLDWVSEAQIAIARTPGTYSVTKRVKLKEGTRQELPADAWGLLSVTRNFDEDDRPMTPVRLVTRSLLDCCVPDWHMLPEYPIVENYVYDDRYPKEFYVFPPNDGSGTVEVVYMGIPQEVTSEDDVLILDDTYLPAILNYVLFRALSKESDYAAGAQSAAAYFSAYQSELQSAMATRGQTTPNATMVPGAVAPNGGTE